MNNSTTDMIREFVTKTYIQSFIKKFFDIAYPNLKLYISTQEPNYYDAELYAIGKNIGELKNILQKSHLTREDHIQSQIYAKNVKALLWAIKTY